MLPNEPVYVLLDIGVLLKAFAFDKLATDADSNTTSVSLLQLWKALPHIADAISNLALDNAEQDWKAL